MFDIPGINSENALRTGNKLLNGPAPGRDSVVADHCDKARLFFDTGNAFYVRRRSLERMKSASPSYTNIGIILKNLWTARLTNYRNLD